MAGSVRRMSGDDRRTQLLDTAVALAAGGDITSVSVAEIASAADVSEGLLYHYFPTKQSLLVAAVERAAADLVASLDGAGGGSSMERLGAGMHAYLDHVQADPTGWAAVLAARSGELAEIAAAVERHSRALTLRGLGIRSPSAVLTAALDGWVELERGLCLSWLRQPAIPRAAVEDLLESTFVTALAAAARHDRQAARVLARLSGT